MQSIAVSETGNNDEGVVRDADDDDLSEFELVNRNKKNQPL